MNGTNKIWFDVGLDNAQLKKDAQEASNAIRNIGKTAMSSGSLYERAMSHLGADFRDVFDSGSLVELSSRLKDQKKIVADLEAQYIKAEQALKNLGEKDNNKLLFSNQDMRKGAEEYKKAKQILSDVNKELRAENKALTTAEQLFKKLSSEIEKLTPKQKTYTAQLQKIREEMVRLQQAGNAESPRYRELQAELGKTGTAYRKVREEQKYLTTAGNATISGLLSGMSALSGAFSAGSGIVSLFVSDNKRLAAIQTKLQAAMAITIGLQQVSSALHSTSSLRINIVTKATELWRLANVRLSASLVSVGVASKAAQIASAGLLSVGIGALIVGVGYLINKYKEWNKQQSEISRLNKIVNDSLKESALEGEKHAQKNIVALRLLYKASQDQIKSLSERKKATSELQKLYPSYFGNLKQEEILAGKGAGAYERLTKSIISAAKARASQDKIADNETKKIDLDAKRTELVVKKDIAQNNLDKTANVDTRYGGAAAVSDYRREQIKNIEEYNKQIWETTREIGKLDEANKKLADNIKIDDLLFDGKTDPLKGTKQYYQKLVDDNQELLDKMTDSELGTEAARKIKANRDAAQKKLSLWNKTPSTDNKERKTLQQQADYRVKIANEEAKAALEAEQRRLDNEQAILDSEQDSFDKQQKQLDLNHKKALLAIQKRAQELVEKQQKSEREAWDIEQSKLPESKRTSVFTPTTTTVKQLSVANTQEINQLTDTENKLYQTATDKLLKSLTDKYKNYNQRRLDLDKNYNNDIKALDEAYLKAKNTDEQNVIRSAIEQRAKVYKQESKSLSEEIANDTKKNSDLFVRLFTDASRQSVKQIRNIIDETQALYDLLSKKNKDGSAYEITEEDAKRFGFTAADLNNFKTDAKQLEAILNALIRKKAELNNKSPFDSFTQGIKNGIADMKKGGAKNIGKGIEGIGSSIQSFLPVVEKFGDDLGAIFGDETADNIKTITGLIGGLTDVGIGVGKIMSGDIAGGALSAVQGIAKIVSMSSQANKIHKQALKEIEQSRIDYQRKYNLLLKEQNLLLKEAVSIFGEKQITKASNAMRNYYNTLSDIKKEMQGSFTPDAAYEQSLQKKASSGGVMGAYFGKQLQDYKKQVDSYNKGINQLANQQIVTGHKKSGIFGWGKGKDTYSSILDIPEYKGIVKDGKLDIDMTQTILDTRKMSDETRKYLENLIELQKFADKAQEELRSYLQDTFGALGTGAIDSVVDSIKNGTDAWVEFGKVGAGVLEKLGEQIAYELFFSDKFKKLQDQLEEVYGSEKEGETEKEKAERIGEESAKLVSGFYSGIGKDMEDAQQWMLKWKEQAEKEGFKLYEPDSSRSQSSSSKGFETITQDQAGELNGRFTAFQLSAANIERYTSIVSSDIKSLHDIQIDSNKIIKTFGISFDEIRNIQLQSMYHLEDIVKHTKVLPTMANDIAKIKDNTSKL